MRKIRKEKDLKERKVSEKRLSKLLQKEIALEFLSRKDFKNGVWTLHDLKIPFIMLGWLSILTSVQAERILRGKVAYKKFGKVEFEPILREKMEKSREKALKTLKENYGY